MLLDKLSLHLLVLSEDLSFHFKYLLVMHGKVAPTLDDGEGNIDKTKLEFIISSIGSWIGGRWDWRTF